MLKDLERVRGLEVNTHVQPLLDPFDLSPPNEGESLDSLMDRARRVPWTRKGRRSIGGVQEVVEWDWGRDGPGKRADAYEWVMIYSRPSPEVCTCTFIEGCGWYGVEVDPDASRLGS